MHKYQITEISENFAHAGSKATADVAAIADTMGFTRLNVKMDTTKPGKLAKLARQRGFARDYKHIARTVEDDSIVLLQHPFHYPQLTREKTLLSLKNRGCRFISLVHDVEELRKFRDSDYYRHEFEFMLANADVIIVHNEVMREFFVEKGYPEDQLVTLEIFDYLQPDLAASQASYDLLNNGTKTFERAVTVAGNLDVTKCGYIGELRHLAEAGVGVHLYGPNYDEERMRCTEEVTYRVDPSLSPASVSYEGVFPADEIPRRLQSGFGLVWDGNSIAGCVGDSGQYLRYNNPHKLSLYLSSGLPVVIWKEAAEARFVEEHGVGLTVSSLMELPERLKYMEALEYGKMCERVAAVGEKLRSGAYATEALQKALQVLYDLY